MVIANLFVERVENMELIEPKEVIVVKSMLVCKA